MHVLVTGGAGFIGSHTVLELLNSDYTLTVIDNFANSIPDSDGNAVSLKRVEALTGKKIPFKKVDVLNVKELEAVFKEEKFDAVIHLAALKALCKKYNVKNFVFSSSATVYGTPKSLPIREDAQTGPGITNPYGQTKHMIEQILIDLAKAESDWNIVILRYFNPVGAHPSGLIGEDPKGVPNNLMPFVSQVAIGKLPVVKIFGNKFDTVDGTGVRDYIHIVDLARGHVSSLDRISREGNIGLEVYNLGTGKGYSVLEMVAALEKASGRKIPTELSVPRPGDIACVYCDPALAAEKLKWKAEFGLEEMCRDLWNWQEKNPKGFSAE
uniref:UDP-glucose 4-epimerase n=1 Tax=Panagrolaimus sp. PS1159 TaxID=55785 RepID=A0AC35G8Y4_9BILA